MIAITSGIYVLTFNGTDKVYVGQTIDLNRRKQSHINKLRNGLGSKKLQNAYNAYGDPQFTILEQCKVQDLSDLEKAYIVEFDSITNGFNTVEVDSSGKGIHSSGSKYTKEEVLHVLDLLVQTDPVLSLAQVSKESGVHIGQVSAINCGTQHTWLLEEAPDKYSRLSYMFSLRVELSGVTRGLKHCSAAKGIVHPVILSPEGVEYNVTNITGFARENGLHAGNLHKVLKGVRDHHKGWKLKDKL